MPLSSQEDAGVPSNGPTSGFRSGYPYSPAACRPHSAGITSAIDEKAAIWHNLCAKR
jgi:hypothetical protein